MSLPPESIEAGKCYLTDVGQVRRVVRFMPDDRVQFEVRPGHVMPKNWKIGMQEVRSFASQVEREVPCDWTPDMNEAGR